ncbi:MAG: site-2 protease family protein [Ilumatobacteraceae bacterium]
MTDTRFAPPKAASTYSKIRGEVVAGGALGEQDPVAGGPKAVLGLSILAGLLVVLAFASIWAFVFVVGLLISIFLHELGHFVTARRSGMKVTQFFLGMGPKIWSFRRGEVEYGVRALPIGAFVRIIGMNNLDETDPADEPRAYRTKSYPKRMITITAGSFMHMIIAIVLLFGVYSTWGKNQATGRIGVGQVVDGGAAQAAGVEANDIFVSVDGRAVSNSEDVGTIVRSHQVGDALPLVVERDGGEVSLVATLRANPDPEIPTPYLGISSGEEHDFVHQSVGSAFVDSFTDLGNAAWQSVGGVIKVMNPVNIVQHLTGANTDQSTQPVTVYGISRLSSDIGNETGLPGILLTLAGVNVFVGLLNMVPLLPFDGGHAAVATYERIRSRKGREPYRADVAKMVPVAMAVMSFLVFVLFAGLYLDITNPIR